MVFVAKSGNTSELSVAIQIGNPEKIRVNGFESELG